MNNLFSSSWRHNSANFNTDIHLSNSFPSRNINCSSSGCGNANLDRFFEDVESIKYELKEVESLHRNLHTSNETLCTVHAAVAVRDLRSRMDTDVTQALLEWLKDYGQESAFDLWEELNTRNLLVKDIESLDLPRIDRIM